MGMLREKIERWLSRMAIKINKGDAFFGYDGSNQWQTQQILVVQSVTSGGKVFANKFITVPFVLPSASGIPWHKKGMIELEVNELKFQIFKGSLRKLPENQIPKAYKLPNTTTQYNMEN